jgi:hypothetical protein
VACFVQIERRLITVVVSEIWNFACLYAYRSPVFLWPVTTCNSCTRLSTSGSKMLPPSSAFLDMYGEELARVV